MEHIYKEIKCGKSGCDPIYITPLGDIHFDALACDRDKLRRIMQQRSELPNHYFIGLGDFGDWILPDDPRFFSHNQIPQTEAMIDSIIDEFAEEFGQYKWLMLASGNHCVKITKKFHTDPMERLCRRLGVLYGRYAGRLVLRIRRTLKSTTSYKKDGTPYKGIGSRGVVRILYHHGAWGGDASAGFSGAMRWARSYPGWEFFLYGHNHTVMHRMIPVSECKANGSTRNYNAHIVDVGTFLKTSHSGITTYSEKAGYAPSVTTVPLLVAQPIRTTKDRGFTASGKKPDRKDHISLSEHFDGRKKPMKKLQWTLKTSVTISNID